MDIREAVRKALESQGAGPAVLSNRERFLSYVSDYMGEDESPEFNVLVNNYRSGVIEIFAKALEEGTSDALETAYLRGVDLLEHSYSINSAVATNLCYQMAAGICDSLGIAAPAAPQPPAADLTQPRDIFEYPQADNATNGTTGFPGMTADVGFGPGVPPVSQAPWPGTPKGTGTVSRPTTIYSGNPNEPGWETGPVTAPQSAPTPEPNRVPSWLVGAGVGAAIALLMVVVFLVTRPKNAYAVPQLTSLTLAEALEVIDSSEHFEQGQITYQESDTVAKDEVISQTPSANDNVTSFTKIDLVVSSGSDDPSIEVPSLEGLTSKEAEELLADSGLEGEQGDDVQSDTVAKGRVAEQTPGEGTEVAEGTTVIYRLSSGSKSDEQVKVPNLVGLSAADALEALEELGLNGKEGDPVASGLDKGTVAQQSPKAKTKVKKGETVTYQLSKGTASDTSGNSTVNTNYTSHAGNVLEHADQDLSGSTLYYRLFDSAYSTKIVARSVSGGSSRVIFSEPSGRGLFNILCDGQYVYFGIGNDYDGDQLFDSGTIARINLDGSGYRELANVDSFGRFIKFYIMNGRIYYYAGGAVHSIGVDGSGDRTEVQLQGDAEFFCTNGSLYLAEGDMCSFVRIGSDGSRTRIYSGAPWDNFTVGTTSLILESRTSNVYSLRWVDLASGQETGSATCGDAAMDDKGITAYGDDAIVMLQYDNGDQQAFVYRASRGGSVETLWSRSGLELAIRPHALGDRIYFSAYANANSTATPCSISVSGEDFRIDESELSHPGL